MNLYYDPEKDQMYLMCVDSCKYISEKTGIIFQLIKEAITLEELNLIFNKSSKEIMKMFPKTITLREVLDSKK